jgi:3-oxoacyl-[acyl-carrier-protein] synthase III
MRRSVKIIGTGQYLPKNKVNAQALADQLGISASWIEKKSGVRDRYFVIDETTSQMGTWAAQAALTSAQLTPADIDCIVCASAAPEQGIPCTAALVQRSLGITSGIPAFDINATCLSFVTALDMLSYLIEAGRFERVLIISSEIASKSLDWTDPESCTLFGDGAAAAIVARSHPNDSAAILSSRMETYSQAADLAQCLGGGSKHPPEEYATHPEHFRFSMQGPAIYRAASKILPSFLTRLFEPLGYSMADIDLVIPHQASPMAMRLLSRQLNIPDNALIVTVPHYGNTIAASIPMALHTAIQQQKVQRGDRLLLLGTAAGLSAGAIILEY